jgi:hypothetical protein
MTKARGVSLAAVLLLCLAMWSPAVAQTGGGHGMESFEREENTDFQVDPEFFEFTIMCNETVMDSLCVTTPPGGIIEAADILFIMDATGSMGEEMDEVKASALAIMQSIIDLGIDAAFGVGAIQDYPGVHNFCNYNAPYAWETDVPWMMFQDVTTNQADVANAINAITIGNGMDLPENYARALLEAREAPDGSFHYRAGTKRIVLLFGDAPVHDCDFYQLFCGEETLTYGQDLGRDGIMDTADDLDFEATVATVAAEGIIVLVVDSSQNEAAAQHAFCSFEYMAMETGGAHYSLTTASDIPQAILDLISEIAIVDWLTLAVEPYVPFDEWTLIIPNGFEGVETEQTVCFEIQITVDLGTPIGDYNFDLVVLADDVEVARVPVVVHRTGASPTERTTWSKIRAKFRNN